MTSGEPLDDEMFINSNFLALFSQRGRYRKQWVKYNQSSFFRFGSIAVAPQNTAQAKPQPASSSEPKDSIQLSPKAQAQPSGDVDYDGDSHW